MRKSLATVTTIAMLVVAGATIVPFDGQDGSGQTVIWGDFAAPLVPLGQDGSGQAILLGYPGNPIVPFDGQDGSGQ